MSYRMTVHPFGGVWSPSCAAFALQQALTTKKSECPDIVERAAPNFYVDDLLVSLDSLEQASSLVRQLRLLLASRGFRLTKWICNHMEVLEGVPEQDHRTLSNEVNIHHKDFLI